MATEIVDLDKEIIEESALKQVLEHRTGNEKNRWELWVAFSSSVLALLSVIAGLLATFAADEASNAAWEGTDIAIHGRGVYASYTSLQNKLDLLAAMGKPASDRDVEEMKRLESQLQRARERSKSSTSLYLREIKAHDSLVISMTLFQATMLLSGLAVMVGRIGLWRFGLVFSAFGLYFFLRGLIGYMGNG